MRTATHASHSKLSPSPLLSKLEFAEKRRMGSKRGRPPCHSRSANAASPAHAPATSAADERAAADDEAAAADDEDALAPPEVAA